MNTFLIPVAALYLVVIGGSLVAFAIRSHLRSRRKLFEEIRKTKRVVEIPDVHQPPYVVFGSPVQAGKSLASRTFKLNPLVAGEKAKWDEQFPDYDPLADLRERHPSRETLKSQVRSDVVK